MPEEEAASLVEEENEDLEAAAVEEENKIFNLKVSCPMAPNSKLSVLLFLFIFTHFCTYFIIFANVNL